MAGYLVLEEDGTSRLQLEENTDALLLENEPQVSGRGTVGTRGGGTSTGGSRIEIPRVTAKYKGGSFTVPGSTGNFSVTGIGFEPTVVLLFGSNKNTYDSVVSSGVSAVMRGVMAWDDVTATITSWCSSAVPHSAMRWEQKPIVCCDTSGTTGTDYEATAVSLDADGFTVNFTTVPGGTRKVFYVALKTSNVFSKIIGSNFGGTSASVDVGWTPESGLEIGGFDDTVLDIAGPNAEKADWGHMLTWGGKSFYGPVGIVADHTSMFLGAVDTPFSDQDDLRLFSSSATTSHIGLSDNFPGGPFLSPGVAGMTLSGAADTVVSMSVTADNQGHFTALPTPSYADGVDPDDDVADFVDITSANPEVETPALILFLGACGREAGLSPGNPNAMSLGFWTPDQSYCVAANGNDDSFFQSELYAWCSNVTGSGAHAGSVASLAPSSIGARLTTEVAGVNHAHMVWHMFGPPLQDVRWIPHIYRLVMMT